MSDVEWRASTDGIVWTMWRPAPDDVWETMRVFVEHESDYRFIQVRMFVNGKWDFGPVCTWEKKK